LVEQVIVPFGMLYFGFSLIVYKKQILYVYQPVYESGGAMFPGALQKTLFGLTCGQLTFIGYLFTRGWVMQAVFLMPLPIATLWGMGYFNEHYASKFEVCCFLYHFQFLYYFFSPFDTVSQNLPRD
jgi:hypothetical protein